MAVLVPSLYILAGAIACAMLQSLSTPAGRRERPVLLAFAATCLFAALVAVFAAQTLQAADAAQFIRGVKSSLDCLLLTALTFSVFVTWYTRLNGRTARLAFAAYALLCLGLLVVNEARPYGLQYARFDGVTRLPLPWHESIVQGIGRAGPFTYLGAVALVGVIPYALIVLLSLYQRTRDRYVLWMVASLATFVPFAVEGALVRLSILHGFAAGPFGLLVVVAVMGTTLTREAKRKLLDSEERLRVLFEHSPLGIVLTVDGRYQEFNRAFEAMTGYPAEELRRLDHRVLTASKYAEEDCRQVERLKSTGRYGPYEKEYRRKDGSLIPLRLNGVLISNDTRRYVWSIVEDISADRRAQQALQRESAKSLAFVRNASDGIHILDTAGNVIEASDSFCEMLGFPRDEVIGMNVRQWEAGFTPEELAAKLQGLFALPQRAVFETRHRRRDGAIIEVEISAASMWLHDTQVLFNSARDITGRKLIEARLRESEMRFRTLIEQSPMAISFSRDGNTLEVNEHYLTMFGYASPSEVRDTPLLQRIAPSRHAEMQQMIERRRSGLPTPTLYETVGRRKDGSEFPLFVSTKRIEMADGPLTMSFLMDFTERKQAEERIRQLAFFDQLTLLPNRELLQDRLDRALATSARGGHYGALLLLNLDNFKSVNETLGHGAGDELLRQVGAKLAAEARPGDTVARGDGDEFVVLLEELATQPLTAAAQAKAFGLKMMQALSGSYALSDNTIHVTCSVGATILAGRQQTTQDVLKQANIALHQARKSGRNALRFFDPAMQESINERAALEGELRGAIDGSQFALHYQLQVDESGRELGAEALLRWNHPERGLVPPAQFIPLAEESHMILPIGAWVIDAACAQLALWSRSARTRGLSVAVNVSSLQFQQPEFAMQVLACIQRHRVDARRLKLELTETMLQGDLERTVTTMNVLKMEGVQFALDDFGTGYSSLQYLKRLPLDQLKIDRSFVRDIASDPNDRAIVSTIVAMAGHLGLDVMAEGVETPEQLDVLRECGCTRYQGYLFSRPQPAERLFAAEEALASC